MKNIKVPQHIFGDIHYFITGSRRFGTNHKNSDLDICICIVDFDDVKNIIVNKYNSSYKKSDYNNGIKFKYKPNDVEINVIPLHPVDYVTWYHATKLMEATPFKGKKMREELHGLYETYFGLMKSHFTSESITIENYMNYCK